MFVDAQRHIDELKTMMMEMAGQDELRELGAKTIEVEQLSQLLHTLEGTYVCVCVRVYWM